MDYDEERIKEMADELGINFPMEEHKEPSGVILPFKGYTRLYTKMVESVSESLKLYGSEKANNVFLDYAYKIGFQTNLTIKRDYSISQRALEITFQKLGKEIPPELEKIREKMARSIREHDQALENILELSLEETLKDNNF